MDSNIDASNGIGLVNAIALEHAVAALGEGEILAVPSVSTAGYLAEALHHRLQHAGLEDAVGR